MKTGRRIGAEYLATYPKKLGHFTPLWSLIDFTMKFGPFPMYVMEPQNTAPADIATTYLSVSGQSMNRFTWCTLAASMLYLPIAAVKKFRYVGVLSRTLLRLPVA